MNKKTKEPEGKPALCHVCRKCRCLPGIACIYGGPYTGFYWPNEQDFFIKIIDMTERK
jgi:hypothetical protein